MESSLSRIFTSITENRDFATRLLYTVVNTVDRSVIELEWALEAGTASQEDIQGHLDKIRVQLVRHLFFASILAGSHIERCRQCHWAVINDFVITKVRSVLERLEKILEEFPDFQGMLDDFVRRTNELVRSGRREYLHTLLGVVLYELHALDHVAECARTTSVHLPFFAEEVHAAIVALNNERRQLAAELHANLALTSGAAA